MGVMQTDNLVGLRLMPDNSMDSVVTDPPYELGFMGKSWDASGIAYSVELWREVLRVLKPGGHVLAFSASRTYHRVACAIEDAGFEMRDQIMWLYGSGMPKAKTVLKGAHEPIVVARKPFPGSEIANVARWGTGALQIEAGRLGERDRIEYGLAGAERSQGVCFATPPASADFDATKGRWPTNVIHDGLEDDWARFFYCAKASKADREHGLEAFPILAAGGLSGRNDGSLGSVTMRANTHPTVKPNALMRYLVRLVTPGGGIVLDIFAGSGSTGVAAKQEGFYFVGFEQSAEYAAIANARIQAA